MKIELRTLVLAVVAVCVVFFAAGSARADDPKSEAAKLFREATEAYARSDFSAAARAFEASHRLIPRAAAIFNAAAAWEAAGDAPRAADDYEIALERTDLHGSDAARAQHSLASLAPALGVLAITAPDGSTVSVAHAEREHAPVQIHLRPGSYEVRVDFASGAGATRRITLAAGETRKEDFEAPAAASPPAAATPPRTPVAAPSGRPPANTPRTIGWVLVGTSVAMSGAAIFFGVETLDAKSSFHDSNDTSARAHDQAITFRTLTNVAFAGAAVAALTGTILIVTSHGARKTDERAALGIGFGGVQGEAFVLNFAVQN